MNTTRKGQAPMAKTKARVGVEKIGAAVKATAKPKAAPAAAPKAKTPAPAPAAPAAPGRGRPRTDTKPHTIWLAPEEWQAVRLAAFTEEKSHSHVIRRAICASLGVPFTDEE